MTPLDRCNGSGKILHMTDSYSRDVFDCPGCKSCQKENPMSLDNERGHHESEREFAERTRRVHIPPKTDNNVKVKVTISIPVTLGGYTGQRDEWEAHASDFKVAVDGDMLTLTQVSGSSGTQIAVSKTTLLAALKMVDPPGPVMR